MTTDQQLRDQVLKRLYDLRHKGLQSLPDALAMPDVEERVLGNIVGQLRDIGLVRWHATVGGHCRGVVEITAHGVDEIEDQAAVVPPVEIHNVSMHAAHPTHTLIAVFTLIAALVFGGLGVMLVWLGSTGNTTFKILGTDVSSENAGIAAIGLAVVLLLLTFRRVILSTERLHNPK